MSNLAASCLNYYTLSLKMWWNCNVTGLFTKCETRKQEAGIRVLSTFLLQYRTPTASSYVVLHVAGVVGQVCLFNSIEREGQLHLLLPQMLPYNPVKQTSENNYHRRQTFPIHIFTHLKVPERKTRNTKIKWNISLRLFLKQWKWRLKEQRETSSFWEMNLSETLNQAEKGGEYTRRGED